MRRTADNKEFEEFPLIVSDSSVIATDIDNNLFCYKICELLKHAFSASYAETSSFAWSGSHTITASYAHMSSYAMDALSASYSLSGSYVISASWAETSSFALEASAAFSATFATSASHAIYADTASYAFFAAFASASISASYAESASYGTNFYAPRVTASYVSSSFNVITNQLTASDAIIFANGTQTGTLSWNGSSLLTSNPSGQGRLLVSTASLRVPTISASVALLGRADNIRFSQSFMSAATMSYTRSLGTIGQDGMYRLTVAGTIGFYSGSTLVNQPKWQFLHTDRFGSYLLPQISLTPVTLTAPSNYEVAFSFGEDYVFQAVAGSNVSYYYNSDGAQVSSTDCSASFFTSATLTQIMSGSVTDSI